MDEKRCPECGGAMVSGRRRDKGDSFATSQEAWMPGEPEQGVLGWFARRRDAVPVVTYACTECGRLVSYLARD